MARLDWSKVINLSRAVENLNTEAIGDWHHDPWGWPELDYILKTEPDLAYARCASVGTMRAAPIDVPKENWGTRPAVVLDVTDRLIYQALVDRLSVQLVGDMTPNSFGWRLPYVSPKPGEYSHNSRQWEGYRDHLSVLASADGAALATDLVSFFASIPAQGVQEAIQDRCSTSAVSKRLCDMVDGFSAIPNRSGLVQRSTASAVLANMYVFPLDDVLLHHASPLPVVFGTKTRYQSFARWMDDIWLFVGEASAARAAQIELQSTASALGLNLNLGKTDVYEGADVAVHARQVEHSAVDGGIAAGILGGAADFSPLEELIDRLLERPEEASRTSLKFAMQRMRENGHLTRAQEIIRAAPRMPHAADALFRLLKLAFTHDSLQDWYLEYATGPWATREWSVAQLGRTFPSGKRVRKPLREFFAGAVRDANTSLPLLSVACQRLASWDGAEARDACRDAFNRTSSPHTRRVLALTALGAGETRTKVRRWLAADPENQATLKMLEAHGFGPPKVTADFAA